jgi:hypothetical protein
VYRLISQLIRNEGAAGLTVSLAPVANRLQVAWVEKTEKRIGTWRSCLRFVLSIADTSIRDYIQHVRPHEGH